jgi:hypothetical protein
VPSVPYQSVSGRRHGALLLGIVSGAHGRALEVVPGLTGVVAGSSVGAVLGSGASVPGDGANFVVTWSLLFASLPFLLAAIASYVVVRDRRQRIT